VLNIFFLAIFVGGLGLAVYSMLQGIERSRATGRRPSAVLNTPTASSFGIVLGAVGYLLITRTTLGILAVLVISAGAAALAAAGIVTLVARWALPYSGIASGDDSIQGQLALVTSPISASSPGEIVFSANGLRQTLAAQSIQGLAIPRDTEVVIDSVQDGIARVELWSVVEQRL
jgi:hypothetical protein